MESILAIDAMLSGDRVGGMGPIPTPLVAVRAALDECGIYGPSERARAIRLIQAADSGRAEGRRKDSDSGD